MATAATLIIADSERDSDLLWVSGFNAGDPFIYAEVDGKKYLILSNLEYGRGVRESSVDSVVPASDLERELEESGVKTPPIEDIAVQFLRKQGVQEVRVPPRFATRYSDRLRAVGFQLEVGKEPFFPARAVKSPEEITWLEAAQSDTEEVMLDAIDQIRQSQVKKGVLYKNGEPLTVERLKKHIRRELLDRDYQIGDIIVAPGDQGCEGHNSGSGPLLANQSIILDIFPRHLESRYWGDMTRTVVKGKASDELRAMYQAVERALKVGMNMIRPGVTGAKVHDLVKESLETDGFRTERRNGAWCGFFHGTGHGVGLDIHERPRISKNGEELREGMVATVEPGLYYPGIGGVRLEDIVVVSSDGCRNLNRAPYTLEV